MNSFDHPLGEARYDRYLPEDVLPALEAARAEAEAALAAVPASDLPLVAFCDATARYDFIVTIADGLAGTLGGAWRDASRAANQRAALFRSAVYQRADLYQAISQRVPAGPVERRLRADLLRRFERGGAHLDPAGQRRLAAINQRIAALTADFMSNLDEANAAAGVSTSDIAGLPAELVAAARDAAVARGLDGYWIGYSDATAKVVLRQAESRELREAMYRLTVGRAAASNGPVIAEILALRQEFARLLGYPDLVELKKAGRMVADPQALLDQLAEAYRPRAYQEFAELLAFARGYTGDPDLELTAADLDVGWEGFYTAKLRASRGLAGSDAVRVPVPTAVRVMLEALGELYSVTFTPADAPGWHPDVRVWDLRDADGRHLARIWCDWYAREGKRSGGWMSPDWLSTGDSPHLTSVVTNAPRDGADLGDLRIMWHEFGHALHFAFTRTRYRLRSPDNGEHDFIEAPSRIMENWPYAPEILRRMGVDERVAAAARTEDLFHAALHSLVRMARPAIDLAAHRGEDVLATKQRYLPVPVDPADATLTQWHVPLVFDGAYAAGHYAYRWAGVLEADLFTRFAREGVLNPVTGREYREKILAHGAERDPAELVRDFLGRDVELAASLARDGIT